PRRSGGSSQCEAIPPAPIASQPGAGGTARLPNGFRAVEGTAVSADSWPLRIISEKDSAEMAFIPAGSIRMGSDQGPSDARPEVSVGLSEFDIDVTEVTLGQFQWFGGSVGVSIAGPL